MRVRHRNQISGVVIEHEFDVAQRTYNRCKEEEKNKQIEI
jgi:hypothetical protein